MEVRNRFKGLDLIDRLPDELWMDVRDTVQETGIFLLLVSNLIPLRSKRASLMAQTVKLPPAMQETGV